MGRVIEDWQYVRLLVLWVWGRVIEDWQYVRLLVLSASQTNEYKILYQHLIMWKSSQNGCRNCWQLTKNEFVWSLPNTFCCCWIYTTFVVVSSLRMKNTTNLRPQNCANNWLPVERLHQKKDSIFNRESYWTHWKRTWRTRTTLIFGFLGLLPVPQYEKMDQGKKVTSLKNKNSVSQNIKYFSISQG